MKEWRKLEESWELSSYGDGCRGNIYNEGLDGG